MGTWFTLLDKALNQSYFCYNRGDILGAISFQSHAAKLLGTEIEKPMYVQEGSHIDLVDRLKLERAFYRNGDIISNSVRAYVDKWNSENKSFFKAGAKDNGKNINDSNKAKSNGMFSQSDFDPFNE